MPETEFSVRNNLKGNFMLQADDGNEQVIIKGLRMTFFSPFCLNKEGESYDSE